MIPNFGLIMVCVIIAIGTGVAVALWSDKKNKQDNPESTKESDTTKKTSFIVVALYGLCAVIWTVKSILDIYYKTYLNNGFVFALDVHCSIVWIIAFVILIIRYKADKDK